MSNPKLEEAREWLDSPCSCLGTEPGTSKSECADCLAELLEQARREGAKDGKREAEGELDALVVSLLPGKLRGERALNEEKCRCFLARAEAAEARVKELENETAETYLLYRGAFQGMEQAEVALAAERAAHERARELVVGLLEHHDRIAEQYGLSKPCAACAPARRFLAALRDEPEEPKQPCGHPESDRLSNTRCKHGCIYGCLEPKP